MKAELFPAVETGLTSAVEIDKAFREDIFGKPQRYFFSSERVCISASMRIAATRSERKIGFCEGVLFPTLFK